jgi:hypothetical protein
MLFMAEWVEILMSLTSNWNAGDSSGEGLSHWCALTQFLDGHNNYYTAGNNQIFVQNWLNGDGTTNPGTASPNTARSDWVNHTFTGADVSGKHVNGDADPTSYGCALAYCYYLTTQLGFSINEVISNYSGNLASSYHAVTGDQGDPFPAFLGLIEHVFPSGTPATLTGTNPNNMFPIAQVEFFAQKNTFGKDETHDIIDHHGGLVSSAFWVVIDGMSRQAFESLGVQVSAFSGAFFNLSGVTITPNPTGAEFQNGVNRKSPQRIRIPFDITLSNPIFNNNNFPTSGVSGPLELDVSLKVGGTTVSGSSASMQFELIAGGDPFFQNIDPAQNNQPYLSQDLRVFSGAPGINQTPFPGGPTFSNDSVGGAYAYIQALLTYLNGTPSFQSPDGTDPFGLLPNQAGEGQTDTSVAPFVLKSIIPLNLQNNYNFAIARVRMRGTSGPMGAASDVRVFFRVFASQSPDTDYNQATTYATQLDATNHPGVPLEGAGQTTTPFFATNNIGSETDYQAGGRNIQTITIPNGQDEVFWYYGCFLNFYDPNNIIDGHQVQTWLPGTHHCIVAQIAYDDAPIPNGATPMSWDQLAQRNLQFTSIDNPGPAAAHRAPQTFDIRPSRVIAKLGGFGNPPDELMIDWGGIPQGSTASIFWPGVNAADVVALAHQWGGTTDIKATEVHTLSLTVAGGVSYVPIPTGSGDNFAGLITVEVPLGVRAGQQFEVVVRRVASRLSKRVRQEPVPQLNSAPVLKPDKKTKPPVKGDGEVGASRGDIYRWRYVVGSFVVRIPVTTGEHMLIPEQMTLATMKFKYANLPLGSRWAPVLERYIKYSSERLDAIGGNAASVPASLTWKPTFTGEEGGGSGGHGHERQVCGKVVEVLFDCHGHFEGFVLDECCERRVIRSREKGVADLVLMAARKNLSICVRLCGKDDRIEGLTVMA